MDAAQELTGLGTLDDAMVIGGGEGRHLGDAELGHALVGATLPLRRIVDGSHAENAALAGHETRHRVVGADTAGVGERGSDPSEVLDGEGVLPTTAHDVLVGVPELHEVHVLGVTDGWHDEFAGAVLGIDVDGQTEVDRRVLDEVGLAVDLGIGVVHHRHGLEGLHHGVAKDVGEGDLSTLVLTQEAVDEHSLLDDELHGDGAHRGGRRHGQ